jgi:hypothetical protein
VVVVALLLLHGSIATSTSTSGSEFGSAQLSSAQPCMVILFFFFYLSWNFCCFFSTTASAERYARISMDLGCEKKPKF